MSDSKAIEFVNEHILEIRYKPNPQILDHRGNLAESISQHMSLTEWRINKNRVDVHSKNQLVRVFVSFRNAGAVVRNTSLPDYFPNQTNKFLQHLFSLEPLRNPLMVQRFGVKSRFATPSPMPFEELLQQYRRKIVTLTPEAESAFGAELIDIGLPLNFETKSGKINSNGGPMEKEQLAKFFDFAAPESLPEVALYVEFDYWLRPSEEMSLKKIMALVKQYAAENWQRYERIRALLIGS